MKRTDVHAPSRIQPEDYEFVAAITREDALAGSFILYQRELIKKHMQATGGAYSRHRHGGNCHICGAYMIDFAVFYHAKTNTYIRTGFDCAEKLEAYDRTLFQKVRDERTAMKQARAGKLKAAGLLKEKGLYDAAEGLFQPNDLGGCTNHALLDKIEGYKGRLQWEVEGWVDTAVDIIRKLVRYGDLSEKQWAFLGKLIDQIENADEVQAKREAEAAAAPDAPEGRTVVKGTILSVQVRDGYWGSEVKMLVKADEGFKVWSTLPSAISEAEKGDRIEFTVTLKRSDDDRSFAFGSRPSKASILERNPS